MNPIASLTRKDAELKEMNDCIARSDEDRLKQLNPYLHSYWGDLHVSSGCVCMGEKVAITNESKEALIEDLQASHAGSREMVCMAQQYWWPNMNRDLLVCSIECKSCIAIGKNSISVILANQYQSLKSLFVPKKEIEIVFAHLLAIEKNLLTTINK